MSKDQVQDLEEYIHSIADSLFLCKGKSLITNTTGIACPSYSIKQIKNATEELNQNDKNYVIIKTGHMGGYYLILLKYKSEILELYLNKVNILDTDTVNIKYTILQN